MRFDGYYGHRLAANIANWLIPAPAANPSMIQMFRNRDRTPPEIIVPWYGEFPGKYLTSAATAYRISKDPVLLQTAEKLIAELAEVQDRDGYLGPHPESERMVGAARAEIGGNKLWDPWSHYHCMYGLLMWNRETGHDAALRICLRAADYVCAFFLGTGREAIEAGEPEKNLAIIHIFCLLYEVTGDEKYWDMVKHVERNWAKAGAGNYLNDALAGLEFYQMNKPRWESLHSVQALGAMYRITQEDRYRSAFEHIWWSIVGNDRYNGGQFSSGEMAQGNPYHAAAKETCCTVAYAALTVDMLTLTGDSYVADELELSVFNALLGAQHPSGRWCTYDTPMNGVRRASAHSIVFQAYQGSPELNCCAVNGPRGVSMVADWAAIRTRDGVNINYFGPCVTETVLPSGNVLTVEQATDYPVSGDIRLSLNVTANEVFALGLRVPFWSIDTVVSLNGSDLDRPRPGRYLQIERTWKSGDVIDVSLDLSLHYWVGENEAAGKASIYRGPLLLAYDQRFNATEPENLLELHADRMTYELVGCNETIEPWLLIRLREPAYADMYLCDFASAGCMGTRYISWLPMKGFSPVRSDRETPVWNVRT